MSLINESRVTVTEKCSETLPVPGWPSQSRNEVPYNPKIIIYYFWLTVKKVMPLPEPLTARAQESLPAPKLQHSSATGKGPGLSLNRAQGLVGLRSQVRLLRASCSHEVLTSKPDDDDGDDDFKQYAWSQTDWFLYETKGRQQPHIRTSPKMIPW